jgi:hypothetical protein
MSSLTLMVSLFLIGVREMKLETDSLMSDSVGNTNKALRPGSHD